MKAKKIYKLFEQDEHIASIITRDESLMIKMVFANEMFDLLHRVNALMNQDDVDIIDSMALQIDINQLFENLKNESNEII